MPQYVDVYFSDNDLDGAEMDELIAGNPVTGVVSRRVSKWWEVAPALASLGRDPIQAKLDARIAKQQTESATSWNGTRVAVVIR